MRREKAGKRIDQLSRDGDHLTGLRENIRKSWLNEVNT